MGGAWASSVCSSGVLGLIDDPIAQDLQESQSKLINARWIDFVATENESSLSVFRDALTIINLFKWEEISKVVTESSHGMYQAGVALVLNTAILKQISNFVLQDLIEKNHC